ncbi:unnamed protein product [Lactuca saligna]|uniref:DUF4283 domain-containing protein n=1 Tax=Lactuca saligna TaxID=75948 RepID=A0AA35YVW3_LACSI|nr:unnamed protein product [Lactuca saligna]
MWVDVEGVPLHAWSKLAFRQILDKWGLIVHLDDNIGEDVYKSCVCILTSSFDIIFEVIKVIVDGEVFPILIKEALGWNPSFTWDSTNNHQGGIKAFDRFEQEGSNDSIVGNEEASQDPFGIYDPSLSNTVPTTATLAANDLTTTVLPSSAVPDDVLIATPLAVSTPLDNLCNKNQISRTNKFVNNEVAPFKARVQNNIHGFFGGFGLLSGINLSEEDLSHPPGFSNWCFSDLGDNQSVSEGITNSNYFLNELQKNTIEMGESLGYNMDGCLDRVPEILKGHVEGQIPK